VLPVGAKTLACQPQIFEKEASDDDDNNNANPNSWKQSLVWEGLERLAIFTLHGWNVIANLLSQARQLLWLPACQQLEALIR
jgi:hypothetical protein